jgi:hypothetical protein
MWIVALIGLAIGTFQNYSDHRHKVMLIEMSDGSKQLVEWKDVNNTSLNSDWQEK